MSPAKKPDKSDTPRVRTRARRRPGGEVAKAWQPVFLDSLSRMGVVSYACAAAGISRQVAYRTRDQDEQFAEAWENACEIAADVLEREAHRRAVEGVDEPVFQKGEHVGEIRRYSDQLLMFLLRARRPQRFDDRHRHDAGDEPTAHFVPSPAGHRRGMPLRVLHALAAGEEPPTDISPYEACVTLSDMAYMAHEAAEVGEVVEAPAASRTKARKREN